MSIISINGNSLDPNAPTLRAFNLVQDTAKSSNYILVQTNSPLTKEIKKGLAEKHVEIQEKVSEDTYLCRYTPEVRTSDWDHIKLELTFPLGPLRNPWLALCHLCKHLPVALCDRISTQSRSGRILANPSAPPCSGPYGASGGR